MPGSTNFCPCGKRVRYPQKRKTAALGFLAVVLLGLLAQGHADQKLRLDHVVEHKEYSTGAENVRLQVRVKAVDKSEKMSPIGVSAVIDTSGSMTGPRIFILKETMKFLAQELTKTGDAMGLVTFDTEAREVFQFQELNPERLEILLEVIGRLDAEGRTDLSGGLLLGLDQIGAAEDTSTKCRTQEVFLFSDGDPNQGITKEKKLKKQLNKNRDDTTRVTTFPFGALANYTLLQNLAEAGAGESYIMDRLESMADAFAMGLTRLKTTVAQNIVLTFTPLPGAKIHHVQDGGRVEQDGDEYRVIFPNLSLEKDRIPYLEMEVEPGLPGFQEILQVQLTYEDTTRCREVVEEGLVVSIFRAEEPDRAGNDTQVIETLCAKTMGQALLVKEAAIDPEKTGELASEMKRIGDTMRGQTCCNDSKIIPGFILATDQLREMLLSRETPTKFELALYRELGDSLMKGETSLPSIDSDTFHFLHFYDTDVSKQKRQEAKDAILKNTPASDSDPDVVPFSGGNDDNDGFPAFENRGLRALPMRRL